MPTEVIQAIQRMLRLHPKTEICGIVTSKHHIIPISNAARNPEQCFLFSKREYFQALGRLRAMGETILCIYHTHPLGTAEPSQADKDYIRTSKQDALIVSNSDYRWVPHASLN